MCLDAFNLPFAPRSIDKIVTDPPWSLHEPLPDLGRFYAEMITELQRMLKQDGIAVILTAQRDLMRDLLRRTPSMRLVSEHATLVAGRKARAFTLTKRA